jgi:aryl-alcohol dehydrogenase-like predicted oxidoreductase
MPYSLLAPETGRELLPLLEREGVAAAPYRVLQGGLLTGKYRRGSAPPQGSRRQEKPEWLPEPDPRMLDELERLEAEARAGGRTLLEYALRRSLEQPAVVSLVLGVKSVGQLDQLAGALSR